MAPTDSLTTGTATSVVHPDAPPLSPYWAGPFSDPHQIIGSCCGLGLTGTMAGKTSTEALPFRTQDVSFNGTLLGPGGAPNAILFRPQTRLSLTTGVGDSALATLDRPGKLTYAHGDMQKGGPFFNRYCYLITGMTVTPCGLTQGVEFDGENVDFTPQTVVDSVSGIDTAIANVLAQSITITGQSPDEECLVRLSLIEAWPGGQFGVGNDSTDRSGQGALNRDYMLFQQSIMGGSVNNEQLQIALELIDTKLFANAGASPLKNDAPIGDDTLPLTGPRMCFRIRYWGHAVCCPVIEACAAV